MHWSVAQYSQKMMLELRRHNYVTPTNYLELVSGYKKYGNRETRRVRVLFSEMISWKIPKIWPGGQAGGWALRWDGWGVTEGLSCWKLMRGGPSAGKASSRVPSHVP